MYKVEKVTSNLGFTLERKLSEYAGRGYKLAAMTQNGDEYALVFYKE